MLTFFCKPSHSDTGASDPTCHCSSHHRGSENAWFANRKCMWRISCFSKGQIHSVNADLHAENSSENDAYGTTWLYLDKRKLLVKVAFSSEFCCKLCCSISAVYCKHLEKKDVIVAVTTTT